MFCFGIWKIRFYVTQIYSYFRIPWKDSSFIVASYQRNGSQLLFVDMALCARHSPMPAHHITHIYKYISSWHLDQMILCYFVALRCNGYNLSNIHCKLTENCYQNKLKSTNCLFYCIMPIHVHLKYLSSDHSN